MSSTPLLSMADSGAAVSPEASTVLVMPMPL
jgi:hypothetical protein